MRTFETGWSDKAGDEQQRQRKTREEEEEVVVRVHNDDVHTFEFVISIFRDMGIIDEEVQNVFLYLR